MVSQKQPNRAFIIGCGITAFSKPVGERETYELGLEAMTKALIDAGVTFDDIEAGVAGMVYGESCVGQRCFYQLGLTGIPLFNVSNACATGSSAIHLVRQQVESGMIECGMAIGVERMEMGGLKSAYPGLPSPRDRMDDLNEALRGTGVGPKVAQQFANGMKSYMEKYPATTRTHIAKIAAKNHTHSVPNPYSQFRYPMTAEEVLKDKPVTDLFSRNMCCPTSDGAGACVIASEDFVHRHGLENQAIEIVAQTITTDGPETFNSKDSTELMGANMSRRAADFCYKKSGAKPSEVGVCELHDCFAGNELITYDALQLCEKGKAGEWIDAGGNTYGGSTVVNPSGGLIAKGHPIGATGLGMHFYMVMQLRGWAGPMQVKGLVPEPGQGGGAENRGKYAMVHNLGLGGACNVSLLRRPEFWRDGGVNGRDRLGYNHGAECRRITKADVKKVASSWAQSEFLQAPALAKL